MRKDSRSPRRRIAPRAPSARRASITSLAAILSRGWILAGVLLASHLPALHGLTAVRVAAAGEHVMAKGRPFVNQAGYNLGEAKRATCPGAPDGTPFRLLRADDGRAVFTGQTRGFVADFSAFDPTPARVDYIVEVEGFGRSVPFAIADYLLERIASRLAYQFFIDVRGGYVASLSPANVTGGGPSRDGGGQGLEATFEGLLYASNPALFDRWTTELQVYGKNRLWADLPPADPVDLLLDLQPVSDGSTAPDRTPDLVKLLLWHAEFAYVNHAYTGRTGGFESGADGYEGHVRQFGYTDATLQSFDHQNLLDQLAAACAFYHAFLKPYMPRETYEKYRKVALEKWEAYDRQKEVRYWVKSRKWIDEGRLEFNEQGSAFGQGLLRNLLMYLAEREEPRGGESARFLAYARACAEDIIQHWNFNDPVHMWRARNAEHITPQALALFLLVAPDQAPAGAREKLAAWRDYLRTRTNNLWQYRTHDDQEWAHPKSKEVGTVAGMGGSAFAVAAVLHDPALRAIGWSQVDFVFGRNPAGAHLSNKSRLRVAIDGYWPDVEVGWPHPYVHGTGELGASRGALDGSPTDAAFPFNPADAAIADRPGVYGTEGWAISNRAWMSTVTFSTLDSHAIRIIDPKSAAALTRAARGQTVRVELHAALNLDPARAETAWVEVTQNGASRRVLVTETGPDTSRFTADVTIDPAASGRVTASYGYLAFRKSADVSIP